MNHQQIVALVKLYSKNIALNVKIGGSIASTNGSTTTIPGFKNLSDEMIDILMGFIAHESEHNKSSNFDLSDKFNKPYINLFEDHRIERLAATSFPGFKTWFQKLDAHLYKPMSYEEVQSLDDSLLINQYLIYFGSTSTMGRTLDNPTLLNLTTEVVQRFGQEVCLILDRFLDLSKSTTSTMDCCNLSDELEKELKISTQQNIDNKSSKDIETDDSTTNQNESFDNRGNDDSKNDLGNNPNDSEDNSKDGSFDDESDEGTSDGNSNTGVDDSNGINSIQSLVSAIPDKADSFIEELNELAQDQEVVEEVSTAGFSASNTPPLLDSDLEAIISTSETHNVRRALAHILQEKQRKQVVSDKRGNRLYGSKLHRIATHNPNIFKKSKSPKICDYDFTILLDSSGSMRDVMEPVLSVTQSLMIGIKDNKNCSLSFSTFPDKGRKINRGAFFDKNFLNGIRSGGGTPIESALSEATNELSSSRNKKVVLTITDLEVDLQTAASLNRIMKESPNINYIWIGINTKFTFPINGHVIDDVDLKGFAPTLKALANKLVA